MRDPSRPQVDAVDLEVVKASLSGIVQEMQNSLFRTGYSTIVRESQDASCALMNAAGEVVAQHVVLPLHIGAFPACCGAVIKAFGSEIAEGDAFLINHPYQGGSPHAPDMAVLSPVFCAGALIGFCGSIAHKSDIGGPVPGSCSGQAREIFNEGLHLPAVRYQRAFAPCPDIERIIAANSRTPELVLGDIRGQLGADRLGEKRLGELIGKYGRDKILACWDRLFELSEAAAAAELRGMEGRALRGRAVRRRRRHRSQHPGARPCGGREDRRPAALRFQRLRRPDPRPGQCAAPAGAGRLRLLPDLADRSRHVCVPGPAQGLHHHGARGQRAQSALSGAGQHLQSDRARAGRRGL